MEDGKQGLGEFSEINIYILAHTVSYRAESINLKICWTALSSGFCLSKKHISPVAGTQEEAARAYDIAAIEYRGINAVTNFDLSTYIRWLNPTANNPVVPLENQANTEPQSLSSSNFAPSEESEPLFFHSNSFTVDDRNSPHKQEEFQAKIPIEPCSKSSSPTALGLLLRSSIFRELVEKNSNVPEDENDAEDTKNQQQVGSDDEYGIFYEGISDIVGPLNGDHNELQERLPLPFTISQGNHFGTVV